jgi:Family of unknown function (DUF5678)
MNSICATARASVPGACMSAACRRSCASVNPVVMGWLPASLPNWTVLYYRAMSNEPSQTKDWTELFAKYCGQWVALADDELTVLAAGATAKDALAASVAKGSPEPILYRVPDNLDTFVGR